MMDLEPVPPARKEVQMPSPGRNSLASAVWLVLSALATLGLGPCGPIPGGALSGQEIAAPISDWSSANEVDYCYVEVRPESPRSMTVNCMAWEGRLFVSCSQCAHKSWAEMVAEDPRGRVRVGDSVHPVTIQRVTDPTEFKSVWQARARKTGGDPTSEPKEGWWTFELVSR